MEKESKVDTLHGAVTDALSIMREAIAKMSDEANLRSITLRGIAQSECDHASAILQLADGNHIRSAKVLLRTLIEGWIVAKYVIADENDQRARSYVMKELEEIRRFLKSQRRLADKSPAPEQPILIAAGHLSRGELEERISRLDTKVEEFRKRGVQSFPNVADCAIAVDVEETYRSVYGFLLSAQVHTRAGDTLKGHLTEVKDRDDSSKVLLTTLYLLVQMLDMTSSQFGHPSREAVDTFEKLLLEWRQSM